MGDAAKIVESVMNAASPTVLIVAIVAFAVVAIVGIIAWCC